MPTSVAPIPTSAQWIVYPYKPHTHLPLFEQLNSTNFGRRIPSTAHGDR